MKPLALATVLTASIWAGVTFPAMALAALLSTLVLGAVADLPRKTTK